MSWVCDYCSTVNKDDDIECFVCGKERSKESIREAKRIEREERTKRISEIIYKGSMLSGKILCFSSVVLFSVIALIVLCLKIKDGSLGDLFAIVIAIVQNVVNRFELFFAVILKAIVMRLMDSPLRDIGTRIELLFLQVRSAFPAEGEGILHELFENRSLKYEILLQKLVCLKDSVADAFHLWWTVISMLVVNVVENIRSIGYNVGDLVQKVKEPFVSLNKE